LALNPYERMDSLDFLKICRADLDRLIEQSPPIPEDAIELFEDRFNSIPNLKKPDICGELKHTHVFESSDIRLKQVAVDAAIMLKQRRNMLTELTMPKIQERINEQIDTRLEQVLDERKKNLEVEIELERQRVKQSQEDYNKAMEERQKKIQEEIDLEKKKLPSTIKVDNSRFESRLSLKRNIIPMSSLTQTIKNKIILPDRVASLNTIMIDKAFSSPPPSSRIPIMGESPILSPRIDTNTIPVSTDMHEKSIESFAAESLVPLEHSTEM